MKYVCGMVYNYSKSNNKNYRVSNTNEKRLL